MAIVRQRTTVFNKPVGVVRSNVGAQQVGNAISQAASGIQRIAFQEASEVAQKTGTDFAKALDSNDFKTTNPETGETTSFKPLASPPSGFGTIASQAYQRVLDQRYENSINNELQIKAKEVALKYPLDPESYKDVMSDYIANLSEGSIGKYKEFIKETGANWVASTELDIKKQVFQKSQADAANSIGSNLNNVSEDLYKIAKTGEIFDNSSRGMIVFNKQISNHKDGIDAGLINVGSTEIATDQMSKLIAAGTVEHLMSISTSKSQRDIMLKTIRDLKTGSPLSILSSRGFTADQIKSIKQISKFSGQLSVKDFSSLINHGNSSSSTYDVVEANEDAVNLARSVLDNTIFEATAGQASTNVSRLASGLMDSYDGITDGFKNNLRVSFKSLSDGYTKDIGILERRLISDSKFTQSDFDSAKKKLRQQYIEPLLIRLAQDGDAKGLKAYLVTNDSRNSKLFTPEQVYVANALMKSSFFDSSDHGYMSEVLGRTINERKENASKQVEISNLDKQLLNFKPEEFDGIIRSIGRLIDKGTIGAVVASQKTATAYKFQFDSLLDNEILSGNLSSSDLNQINIQLRTSGMFVGEQVEGSVQEAVNNIIKNVPKEFRKPIIDKISALKTGLKEQETINTTARDKAIKKQQISTGSGGDLNSAYDRNISQEIMNDLGVDLSKFNTYGQLDRQRILSIARKVPPQGLVDVLNQISSGQPVEGIDGYLDLFAALNSDPTLDGQFINRFGKILGEDTQSFLEEINELRQTIGADPERNTNSIVTTLFDRLSRTESIAVGLSILNSNREIEDQARSINKAASNFTQSVFPESPLIAKEFESIAKFYALLGKSPSQIEDLINTRFEKTYLKTEFVVDHRYPNLDNFRSKSSLDAIFPDNEDRNAFIGIIESQLPDGYSLFPETVINSPMDLSSIDLETMDKTSKRVFLAPNPNGSDTDYYAYFLDKNNELKPLFIMEDNKPVSWPMFNANDEQYLSYLTIKNARLKIEEEAELSKDQKTIDIIQARPGFRIEDLLNIFK